MKRVVVLISGRGTNLAALIEATDSGDLDVEIAGVICNRPDAGGLATAAAAGVAWAVVEPRNYATRATFDAGLASVVEGHRPDLVVLAGWMLILGSGFLDRFANRVINLHPALPGCYPGTSAIERAYQAFLRGDIDRTGVMVHHVVPEVDAGPVIVEESVPILPQDTLAALTARVQRTEHRLIVEAVRKICLS